MTQWHVVVDLNMQNWYHYACSEIFIQSSASVLELLEILPLYVSSLLIAKYGSKQLTSPSPHVVTVKS